MLLQTSDCLLFIAGFLEPRELQALRCASKGLKASITYEMKKTSMKNTLAKYSRVVRMRDGAIRIHTRLGRQRFDMYSIPNAYHQVLGVNTPMYTLKQDGMGDQFGSITRIELYYQPVKDSTLRDDILKRGNDALLEANEFMITNVNREYDGVRESTAFRVVLDLNRVDGFPVIILVYEFSADVTGKTPVERSYLSENKPL
jgi:hypothetical protein